MQSSPCQPALSPDFPRHDIQVWLLHRAGILRSNCIPQQLELPLQPWMGSREFLPANAILRKFGRRPWRLGVAFARGDGHQALSPNGAVRCRGPVTVTDVSEPQRVTRSEGTVKPAPITGLGTHVATNRRDVAKKCAWARAPSRGCNLIARHLLPAPGSSRATVAGSRHLTWSSCSRSSHRRKPPLHPERHGHWPARPGGRCRG